MIRGKYRVYLHLTIEGKAKPKYDKLGDPRHKFGKGIVGADIGTQTVAYTSDTEVGLKNLAERGHSIQKSERLERLYYRAMDRSRRATNPQNYNSDGTIKKGRKNWKYSNHYKRLKAKHSELCRINATNRQLAINEDANHLRSLGDVFITESKNASKLMKRAKKTTINDKGRFHKKKRFGRSIKNRCPGGFQTTIEKKFKISGGTYIEVPDNYRASQYDHTVDDYIKKKLSDRMYHLADGTFVQRDWYSSFLLYCYDFKTKDIDKKKCVATFATCYNKEKTLIARIKANKMKILNSGIKIA
jgi:transposase